MFQKLAATTMDHVHYAAQNAALGTAVRSPAVGGVLGASGIEVVAGLPDGFARHIAAKQGQ